MASPELETSVRIILLCYISSNARPFFPNMSSKVYQNNIAW
jgi:hypothetical protein